MTQMKKFRFGDRSNAAQQNAPAGELTLTPEDETNLLDYMSKIKETVDILQYEIAAIKKGDLAVVGEVFERKERALKWLELRTPLIEPFLNHEFSEKLMIRKNLSELKKNIEEDDAMLSRMAIAARTILREFEKIINRNGLNGVYGKTGQKLGKTSTLQMSVDQKF